MPDVLRTVGRYEVVRELGRGASGRLHLARRPDLDGLVALEELDSLGAGDPAAARRFVRTAGSLTHPNIVTVYDVFEHDGTPFVAMELLERGSLRRYAGGLTLAQVAGVLEGMLAGLAHAEEHGVVHGELTPESLMVTEGRAGEDRRPRHPAAGRAGAVAGRGPAGRGDDRRRAPRRRGVGGRAPLDSRLRGWVERMRGAGRAVRGRGVGRARGHRRRPPRPALAPRRAAGGAAAADGRERPREAAGRVAPPRRASTTRPARRPRGPRLRAGRPRPPAPFTAPATAAGNGMTAPGAPGAARAGRPGDGGGHRPAIAPARARRPPPPERPRRAAAADALRPTAGDRRLAAASGGSTGRREPRPAAPVAAGRPAAGASAATGRSTPRPVGARPPDSSPRRSGRSTGARVPRPARRSRRSSRA